jgi:hypothetical protein
MDPVLVALVALTIITNIQLYRFVRAHRRAMHDSRQNLLDDTRSRWFRLLVRRYEEPELKREQALAFGFLALWLVAVGVWVTSL